LDIEQTSKILAMIALIENRKFTDEQIAAWQVLLRDTSFTFASESVVHYYQSHTETIKPAHIYKMSKDLQAEKRKKVYGDSDS